MKIQTSTLAVMGGLLLAPVTLLANDLRPIVDFQSGYLLGSAVGNGWRMPEALLKAKTLPAQRKYRVYSAKSYLGEVTGARAISQGAPCPATRYVVFSPSPETAKYRSGVIAIGGSWNALPRPARPQNPNLTTYRASVAQILRSKGIAKPTVRIAQVWRVDLEGDGVDEVLINATNHQGSNGLSGSVSSNSNAGEYSMIVLRKVVRGKVQTSVIEGAFYPKPKTFNAPSVFKLLGTFDVNGDGKLEIVTKGRYYEGDWTTVYTTNINKTAPILKFQQVLGEGCGA